MVAVVVVIGSLTDRPMTAAASVVRLAVPWPSRTAWAVVVRCGCRKTYEDDSCCS